MADSSTPFEPPAILKHALTWADTGWPVLWTDPEDKRPLFTRRVEGRILRGVNAATTDRDELTAQYHSRSPKPQAYGCRIRDGYLVLDSDAPGAVEKQESDLGALPPTRVHRTGREAGGRHLFFRLPDGTTPAATINWRPGIDLRCGNTYVVMPGSLHRSGRRYEVETDREIAMLPDAWVEALPTRVRAPGGLCGRDGKPKQHETDGLYAAELGLCPWDYDPARFGYHQFAPWLSRHRSLVRGLWIAYHRIWGPARQVALASLRAAALEAEKADDRHNAKAVERQFDHAHEQNAAGVFGVIDPDYPTDLATIKGL